MTSRIQVKLNSIARYWERAIRYRASGHGALGYCKFSKVFSAKIYFQAIHESFLLQKKLAIRYMNTVHCSKILCFRHKNIVKVII